MSTQIESNALYVERVSINDPFNQPWQSSEHVVQKCDATTGHMVRAIAFCDTPERATRIVAAINAYAQPITPAEISANHKALAKAASAFLERISNITSDEFSRGGERPEREELAVALAEFSKLEAK
jgi:hypothetical protein